jgi:hypothetical protein
MDDEFKYVVDENGDRILVGLTQSETLEFERLDALRRDHSTELSFVTIEGALQPPRGKKVAGAFRRARAGPLGIDRSNKGNKALKCSNRGLPSGDGCPQLRYELRRTSAAALDQSVGKGP